MMRVLLSTLAVAAFGQDLFLGRATSCELAALAGNWATTGTSCASGDCTKNASVTLNAQTCELSGRFHIHQESSSHPSDFELINFQPANFSPDLFEAVGWRQSGDNAVQGFQARENKLFASPNQYVGWFDPSTQSVTLYLYTATGYRGYDFDSFWVRSGPTGRGAPALDASRLATSRRSMGPMVGVAEPHPCEGKWPMGLLSLLPGYGHGAGFHVSSSAVTISPGFGQTDTAQLSHFSNGIVADWLRDPHHYSCEVTGSIIANDYSWDAQLPPKTLSANLTNFSIVALPASKFNEPVAAVSMTVSTEHGDGSAVLWRGGAGYFMYCHYQDGSKEIFMWQYDN